MSEYSGMGRSRLIEEIKRLVMIEEAWKLQKHMPAAVVECLDKIEELEDENESLRADAERYRWLRDDRGYFPEENMLRGGIGLDIAIDAAISSPENPS